MPSIFEKLLTVCLRKHTLNYEYICWECAKIATQFYSLRITSFIICSSYYVYIFIKHDVRKITQVKLYVYLCVYLFIIQYTIARVQTKFCQICLFHIKG
jgi:hypothetical protein